jgi:hypothetical protein
MTLANDEHLERERCETSNRQNAFLNPELQAAGVRYAFGRIEFELKAFGVKPHADENHLTRGRNRLARVVELENMTKTANRENRDFPVKPGTVLLNTSSVAHGTSVDAEEKICDATSAEVVDEAHDERED